MPCVQCAGGAWECGPDQGALCGEAAAGEDWCCGAKQKLDSGIWYLIVSREAQGNCDWTVEASRWSDTLPNQQNVGMINVLTGEDGVYELCCKTRDGSCYVKIQKAN